jgi:putative membrane protein
MMRIGILAGALVGVGAVFSLGAGIASAHQGIPPGQTPLTAWGFITNPVPSLFLLASLYLYINGLNNWPNPTHPINNWQKASFFAGIVVLFAALQSPVEPLAEHYFAIHQVQHLLVRMVGPLLILLGAPLTPMLRGMPTWLRQGVIRPVVRTSAAHWIYGKITNPVFTIVLFLGLLFFWQVPGPHDLAVHNDYVHELMHGTMLLSGFLFWWIVVDPKPHQSRLHYGLRVLYLGLIVLPNTLLGAAITFQEGLIYSSYQELPRPWEGFSYISDQRLGGLTLWVPGDMMCIIGAGVVMFMWYQREMELNPNPPMPVPAEPAPEEETLKGNGTDHRDAQ